MEKKNQTLRKPNAALVMVPRLGRLTPVTRKIYNVMLYRTQTEIGKFVKEGREIDAKHLFSAPLSDLTESITAGESDPRTLAKQYLREMRRTEVDWEAPDSATGVIWRSMGLLSEVDLEVRDGTTWVLWALPPTLLAAVSDPERYTPLDLSQMAKLRGYTAIALYEICSRYRNNPTGVTSKNPPEWWVDALTNAPATVDLVTGVKRRREWRKLKSESVGKAIEEINEKTDLEIQLHEFKNGKAVTEVQFSVRKKRTEMAVHQPTMLSAGLAEHAAKLDISLVDVAKMIEVGHSEDELKVALSRLEARLNHPELDKIENKLAYLRKLISEGGGKIKPAFTVQQTPIETSSNQGLEVLKTWKEQRRADIKEELMTLSKDEQKRYAEMALNDLRKAGFANPSFARKVQAGDWLTGVLLSKVIDAYAIEIYGPDWGAEPIEETEFSNA